MASLRARPGPSGRKVWQVRIKKRGHPELARTFDLKGEAEAWAKQVETEMDRGIFVSRTEAEGTTLAEALNRYRTEIVPQKKNAERESRRVNGLIPMLGPLALRFLASIRGKDIMSFMKTRQAGCAGPNTVRLDLALLSHLFNVARTAWGMESLSNPVELVKGQRPKLPSGRDRRLVGDEQARLLAAAYAYGGEIGSIITWAIETAMRQSEIAYMRWERIDWQTYVLTVPWQETKTSTTRGVPLSTAALAVLGALPRQIDGLVWGMRPGSISRAFKRVCRHAGIEGLTFHDLRHEATSRLFEKQEFNAMEVSSITGHKSMQMLKRYTHLRAEDLAKRMK
jgi:integrase